MSHPQTKPSWEPFAILTPHVRPRPPRDINTVEGVGDRLRTAAFAEIQAREAFLWAAKTFTDAPEGLTRDWIKLAAEEDKHLNWLLNRMKELNIDVRDREVSEWLWDSFMICKTARDFTLFMSNAEERGRKAGVRFYQTLLKTDPISAKIFGQIAKEEIEHIRLAETYFPGHLPVEPNPLAPREVSPNSATSTTAGV